MSPEVARLAIEQEGRLEGEVVECTVLFVDIRRFTSLAEVLPPTRLIGILNRYFERMLPVVEAEGGIVNGFGGDSNLEQVAEQMPELRVGFGMATGELVAGNIGSSRKREYTVIGDPVNLAARLQELTPELGADVLMNATTAQRAPAVARFRSLGLIEIRGRAERVEVFSADEISSADAAAVSIGDVADPAERPSSER